MAQPAESDDSLAHEAYDNNAYIVNNMMADLRAKGFFELTYSFNNAGVESDKIDCLNACVANSLQRLTGQKAVVKYHTGPVNNSVYTAGRVNVSLATNGQGTGFNLIGLSLG
jgi:hypothetical protein